jgi:hypothetical protein
MLRLLVLLLIFANGLYWAWSQGWLQSQGFGPVQQTEPQRMAQQIRPEAIRIVTSTEHKKILAQAQADQEPKHCLTAGPFEEQQLPVLETALAAALPADAWKLESVAMPERWIIYMGKFASTEAMEKKRSELQVYKLTLLPLQKSSLEIGLSLGAYETQSAANNELTKLTQRGIRTAKVMQERAAGQTTYLRLPALTDAMKSRLSDIKSAFAGQALVSCAID